MTETEALRFIREVFTKMRPMEFLEVVESLPESEEKVWLLGLLVNELKESGYMVVQ